MASTDLLNTKKSILKKRQSKDIIFFIECSDLKKIIQHRPFTFVLNGVEKNQKDFMKSINYEIENIASDSIIGIRSDLHSFGFSLFKLKEFLSNSKFKSELIEEEIVAIISNSDEIKDKNLLSRREELDILSAFF